MYFRIDLFLDINLYCNIRYVFLSFDQIKTHYYSYYYYYYYYFGSMCPSGLICKFDQISDFIPVMILKPDVGFLAYRIMLFYKLFCKVPSHFQYPQLLVLLLQAVFSLKFHSRTVMFLALHFHLVERSPT